MAARPKLLVIDGNALIHRSYHALPPLTAPSGELVNAVYGFTASLLKAWKDVQPTHIVACFDLKGPTFRDRIYEGYKATRAATEDDLLAQIPRVKDVVRAFNIPIYEKSGYEADDLIGTITRQAKGTDRVVLTGDMDTMQLVDDETTVYTLRKGVTDTALFSAAAVRERFGVRPDQIIDFKALRGDPSDNIPGVSGIGEKTAADLLNRFESLEGIYENLEEKTKLGEEIKESVKKKLLEHKKEAFLSQQLATIDRSVPINFEKAEAAVRNYDRAKAVQLFQSLGFRSLLTKLPDVSIGHAKQAALAVDLKTPVPRKEGHDYRLVQNAAEWRDFLDRVRSEKLVAVDTETTSLNPREARLLGVSFSWKSGQGWFVVARKEWLAELKALLENPSVKKVGHNLKYDSAVLKRHGIALGPLTFDSMLASYLLNAGTRQHSLDALAFTEFGHEMMPIEALIGPRGKNQIAMEDVPIERLGWYSAEDADFTWRLFERFSEKLEAANMRGVFEEIEMPLIEVLRDMELAGIRVDPDFLGAMSKRVHAKLRAVENKIYELAGHEFNINSQAQLKTVLFDELKIPTAGLGRTKTGISTSSDELAKLRDVHSIIGLISEQRELAKLLSTYIDALPDIVDKQSNRVHTEFNQTVAATGRLSSSNPNLQNIPIRTELGAQIRKAFVADRGFRIISADYSQIELRVIASMANDAAMIEAFRRGEDIHARTAASIAGVAIKEVTPKMRRAAKTVNFGIIYGLGYVGLSQSEGIGREEAKAFIDRYFSIHAAIKDWIELTKALAHERGYVETLFGRRRYFPEINTSNQGLRAQAERMAVNAPIQGTAADLMKLAMIRVHAGLPKISSDAQLLLQVHDELVVEAPIKDIERVQKFMVEAMENVYRLRVPIKVEVGVGRNWGEAKQG